MARWVSSRLSSASALGLGISRNARFNCMVPLLRCRDTVEESIDDGPCMEQVRHRSEAWHRRAVRFVRVALRHIGPGSWNESSAPVGENQ